MKNARFVTGAVIGFACAAVLFFGGCAPYAKAVEKRVGFRRGDASKNPETERQIRVLEGVARKHPEKAVGELLEMASADWRRMQDSPREPEIWSRYNRAVCAIIDILQSEQMEPWVAPIGFKGKKEAFQLSVRKDPRPSWNPSLYRFVPAGRFDVQGIYVKERSEKEGVGAALVAIGKEKNSQAKAHFALDRTFYGVTAVLRFRGNKAELSFEDPLATETVRVGKQNLPLAADFTVPLAVMLAGAEPKKFEIPRLLAPERYAQTARISRLQPFDPEKTVVLVIHGLMDSPATWTPLINQLRQDETIRRNYQFWFYSYPSGYPYPYSAALLRRELDAVQQKYRLKKPIVVIGHSMGGCIARLLASDAGEKLWKEIFGKPVAATQMNKKSRQVFEEALVFDRRKEIGRVIFVAAPLRGSDIAKNPVGRLASLLVRMPRHLLVAGEEAFYLAAFRQGDLRLRRMPNSIDTLAPNSRLVRAVNTLPFSEQVPVNVICGDRGKGGNPDAAKPVKSDGVVPYWSSHVPQAESEKVVPSGHSAHQHPEAIREIERILKRDVRQEEER